MINLTEKLRRKLSDIRTRGSEAEYETLVRDLLGHEEVLGMRRFNQHGSTDTLEHSLSVSYLSYRICRSLGLDYRAAARGGLLHDFYLYDWHVKSGRKGLHGLRHPKIALDNARMHFTLAKGEEEIIRRHMWPVTPVPPKTAEALVVTLADKYLAVAEVLAFHKVRRSRLKRMFQLA